MKITAYQTFRNYVLLAACAALAIVSIKSHAHIWTEFELPHLEGQYEEYMRTMTEHINSPNYNPKFPDPSTYDSSQELRIRDEWRGGTDEWLSTANEAKDFQSSGGIGHNIND